MKKLLKKKNKQKALGESIQEAEMSFLDHLEQLRWHILRAAVSIFVFAILIFMARSFVFETIIFGPLKDWFPTYRFFCMIGESMCFGPPDLRIVPRVLGEQFLVHITTSAILGFICSFPYVFFEIWRFVKPGLYAKEQKYTRGVVFICSVLFMTGVVFGYFIIAPFALNFLGNYTVGVIAENTTSLASYVSYMTMFTLPTGVVFELPIVVYFLSKIGLITPQFMKQYRRHAIVIILILAAIITPPDVVTQFLIGVPIYLLYEISILVSKRVQPKEEE